MDKEEADRKGGIKVSIEGRIYKAGECTGLSCVEELGAKRCYRVTFVWSRPLRKGGEKELKGGGDGHIW